MNVLEFYESAAMQRIRLAWAIMRDGQQEGRIIVTRNTRSGAHTAIVDIWGGAWSERSTQPILSVAKATGGGYDKTSAAIDSAIRATWPKCPLPPMDGRGINTVRHVFEADGYSIIEVI